MSKAAQKTRRAAAPAPVQPAAPLLRPQWLTCTILALAAIAVFSRFWLGVGDSDFWWHLKTGQYIWQTRHLPVPDPFAYTTYMHPDTYPGESLVRHFNLTHEWLSQVIFYGAWSLAGAAGIAALRALLLTLLCSIMALIEWRRTGGFYRAIGAGLIVAASCSWITGERPYLFSYVLLACVIAIAESRRYLWLLPPLFLLWANLHSAYFLGWIVLGAYCIEALIRSRDQSPSRDRKGAVPFFLYSALAVAFSLLNPNTYHIAQILIAYRHSPLQMAIEEWQRPKYWELSTFTVILYASLAALLRARRKARLSDWILYLLFAAAALTAVRNIILVGLIGSLILATYVPLPGPAKLLLRFRSFAPAVGIAVALLFAARIATTTHSDSTAARWRTPAGAANFLLAHHIAARLFNSYESGGYLIWRLWPQNKVFIDGRALSEGTAADYRRISFNADSTGGPSGEELLAKYNIGAIVMPMIDYFGKVYLLPAALSDPSQHEWHLVYADPQAVIYLKDLPPGVTPIPPSSAFVAMETQCNLMLDREGSDCARGVADLYAKIGDRARASQWMAAYDAHGGAAKLQFVTR